MPIDPERFKARDAASYNAVAERFEFWTERVTSPLAHRLVELARLQPGERLIDVGTGSGVVAIAAAKQVGLKGETVGIDLAESMLEIARSKAHGLRTIQFRNMDAERLEFRDGSFDAAISLFALLHFPNPEQAAREMFRVLRPGGRVAIGVGSGMPVSWSAIPALWTRWRQTGKHFVAPQALDRFIANRLPEPSEHETPAQRNTHSLEHLLRRAGFHELRREWKSCTHRIDSPSDFWDLQTTFSSVVRKRLESAPEQMVHELRAEFCRKCTAVRASGGQLVYRNAALIFTAVRPE